MNLKDSSELQLPPQLQKIYRELISNLERLVERNPMTALPSCSLVIKTIKGKEYLYAQGRLASGKQRQVFVCSRDMGMMLEEKFVRAKQDNKADLDFAGLANKALRALGMQAMPSPQWQVLSALSEAGIFRRGGVLVGDAAYYSSVALLGAKLTAGSFADLKQSLDEEGIGVAFSSKEKFPTKPLERLREGFSPFNDYNPFVTGNCNIATESRCMVDFVLSLKRADNPTTEGNLSQQMTAEQRVLLDYLIKDPQPAVVLGRRPLLVKVPQPARQVVYKLIRSQDSGLNQRQVEKELRQAYSLMQLIRNENPSALGGAKNSARARNPEWADLIETGISMMQKLSVARK